MKILILHAHWGNRGDEAAIRAMIDSLRAQLPVEKMWIMVVSPEPPEWFPYEDVDILKYYPKLWVWLHRPLYLLDFADAVITLLTWGRLSCSQRGRAFLRAVRDADVVIHAPGGPAIGDLYGTVELHHIYRLFVAKVLKRKPLFFYAPSMGPFSGKLRNALRRYVLRRADAIILREEISGGYLKSQLGLEAEVTLDSAFQNEIPDQYLERYPLLSPTLKMLQEEKTVGMVITDLQWYAAYRGSPEMAAKIEACAIDVSRYLLDRGYSILLIPQLFGPFVVTTSEFRLLERIRGLDKERIQLLSPDVDAFGQQVLISQLFCVISMRYHPIVFAAKGKTPFIAIYYEHKTKGFIHKTGLDDFSLDVQSLSAAEVIGCFVRLERDYDAVKERLRAVVPLLQEESRKTTAILVAALEKRGRIASRRRPPI